MIRIDWDDRDMIAQLNRMENEADTWLAIGLNACAEALLMESSKQVPHDWGTLQSSGHIEPTEIMAIATGQEVRVIYNMEYAAYMHEGISPDGKKRVRFYQKGRKKKYLEDPLRMNLAFWIKKIQEQIYNHMR